MIIESIELREIRLRLIHFFETSFGRTTERRTHYSTREFRPHRLIRGINFLAGIPVDGEILKVLESAQPRLPCRPA